MKKTLVFRLGTLACLLLMLGLIVLPGIAAQAAEDALRLCAQVLVPSLLPFFICTRLLISLHAAQPLQKLLAPVMHRLFGVSEAGSTALVLGLLGGFPTGAQVVRSLYEAHAVSAQEARRLVLFCNNAGPAFILGVIGSGLLGCPQLGLFLYAMHILSAVFMGILLHPFSGRIRQQKMISAPHEPAAGSFPELLVDSIQRSGASVLNVCLCVTFFSVISGLFGQILANFLPQRLFALLSGLLEFSGGLTLLLQCPAPLHEQLALCSFLLAFSGLSVYAQTAAILCPVGLLPQHYLAVRLVQGLVSAAMTYLAAALVHVEALAVQTAAFSGRSMLLLLGLEWLLCGRICLICRKMSYGNSAQHRV